MSPKHRCPFSTSGKHPCLLVRRKHPHQTCMAAENQVHRKSWDYIGTHSQVASTGAPPPAVATTRTRRPAGGRRRHRASRVWHSVDGPNQWPGTTLRASRPQGCIRHACACEGMWNARAAHTPRCLAVHTNSSCYGCTGHRQAASNAPTGQSAVVSKRRMGGTRARARPRTGCGWRTVVRPGPGGPRTRPAAPPRPAPPAPVARRRAAAAIAAPSHAAAVPAGHRRKGRGACRGFASLVCWLRVSRGALGSHRHSRPIASTACSPRCS